MKTSINFLIFTMILIFLTSCATGVGSEETFLRKYNVPITMTSGTEPRQISVEYLKPENIPGALNTPQKINVQTIDGKNIPMVCYQCAIIMVNAEVPKNVTPTVDLTPLP